MGAFWDFLLIIHLLGLALGVGAATAKLVLLLRCRSNYNFIPTYLEVAKPITKLIVSGLVILTLTGIFWVINGYYFTPLLTVKVILVGLLWVLGPIIDNSAEPRFVKSAPLPGGAPTAAFIHSMKQYLALEITATSLFYVVTVLGVFL